MIDNRTCSEHPRKWTVAAVTLGTGETIGMCLECYSKWCTAQRKENPYRMLSLEEQQLLIKGEQG